MIRGRTAIDGDELMSALLNDVSFDGVTGRVEFQPGTRYRGDRRVGVSYSVLNYQGDDGLMHVGSWTACSQASASCSFSQRWNPIDGTALRYSTADNRPPNAVELQYCALLSHSHDVSSCSANGHDGAGQPGDRLVEFDTPFGCEMRAARLLPCAYVHSRQPEVVVAYIVFGLATALKLYLLLQLCRRRADKQIKRTQPLFIAITLIGGVLLDATTLLLPGEPTVALCALRPSWASVAFTLFFAPLAFKMLNLWLLIGRSMNMAGKAAATQQEDQTAATSTPAAAVRRESERSESSQATESRKGKRRRIPCNRQALGLMALVVLAGAHAGLFAISFSTLPPQPTAAAHGYPVSWEVTDSAVGSSRIIQQEAVLEVANEQCPSWTAAIYIELGLQVLLGLATLGMAWKSRHIFSEYNETGPISFATIIVGSAALVILFVPQAGELPPTVTYMFQCLTLLSSTTLVVLILFGGKLLPCFRGEKPLSFEEWKQKIGTVWVAKRETSRDSSERSRAAREVESISASAVEVAVDAESDSNSSATPPGGAPSSALAATEVRIPRARPVGMQAIREESHLNEEEEHDDDVTTPASAVPGGLRRSGPPRSCPRLDRASCSLSRRPGPR